MLRSVIRAPLNPVLRGPLDVLGSGGSGGGGGGGGVDADAQAVIDAMTTTPNAARQTSIDDFVKDLKAGPTNGTDVWSELDALWVLAAADSQAALLNWKAPSGTAATAVNSPTFTADDGYAGTGSAYINTNWNATDDGVNASQDDMCVGVKIGGVGVSNDYFIGGYGHASGHDWVSISSSGGNARYVGPSTNSGGFNGSALVSDDLLAIDRSGASSVTEYRNGVSGGSSTAASQAELQIDLFILAFNAVGSPDYYQQSSGSVKVAFAGGSLTADQHADLHAAINNYLTGL